MLGLVVCAVEVREPRGRTRRGLELGMTLGKAALVREGESVDWVLEYGWYDEQSVERSVLVMNVRTVLVLLVLGDNWHIHRFQLLLFSLSRNGTRLGVSKHVVRTTIESFQPI